MHNEYAIDLTRHAPTNVVRERELRPHDTNSRYGRQRFYWAAPGAALLAQGCRVGILDLRPPSWAATEGAQYLKGSVLDAQVAHEALADVDEVYHLAALRGMWMPSKEDFHAVNCRGTELMLVAARERGVSRFLHCSTESILSGHSPPGSFIIEEGCNTPDQMPGTYTRSKLLAEQKASQAAATGFPVIIASPTMPIGPHYGNLTPPTLMLQFF